MTLRLRDKDGALAKLQVAQAKLADVLAKVL